MTDIKTKEDVAGMVEGFYSLVNEDDLLGPVFNEVAAVDWKAHMPLMVSFWSTLLLGTGEYRGQPFPKHAVLPLTPLHFERWIQLFRQNLEARFSGPVAAQAMQQAQQIARVFQFKYAKINPSYG